LTDNKLTKPGIGLIIPSPQATRYQDSHAGVPPDVHLPETLDTTRIHSVAGLTGDRTALVTTRPCCAPPHPISNVGLIGRGHVPMPGEVSLAHNGVLFLYELPEFRRHVLEVLRQPLEAGVI
jgi:magnesium chelatase family protein